MRAWLNEREITGLCLQISVDKNIDAAGAECHVKAICLPDSESLPRLNPSCGEQIRIEEAGKTLFFGRVERAAFDAAAGVLTLDCIDPAATLARNQCYGPYLGTPAEITAQICRDCGLTPGTLWEGDGEETRVDAIFGRNAFRAICRLYQEECVTEYRDGGVCVAPRGVRKASLEHTRLLGWIARQSATSVVNRVQLCRNGEVEAQLTDEESLRQHGLRQVTDAPDADAETEEEQMRAMLRGEQREARILLDGWNGIRCGEVLTPDKPEWGAAGDYLVTEVTVCCKNGRITTELGMVSL